MTGLWVGIVDGQFRVMHQRRWGPSRGAADATGHGEGAGSWIFANHLTMSFERTHARGRTREPTALVGLPPQKRTDRTDRQSAKARVCRRVI